MQQKKVAEARKTSTLDVVVGAQFGSEAKGHVVEELVRIRKEQNPLGLLLVIRVAGPNAGHTGYDKTGRAWPLRQVPVAAVVEGSVALGIAPGSEIDPDVLFSEIDSLDEAGLLKGKILFISEEATIIDQKHKDRESSADLVGRVGSTGKGIGAARADRVMRKADRLGDREILVARLKSHPRVHLLDSRAWSLWISQYPSSIIVEGTQGFGLGLRAGHYPQCTSSDTRAIDFLAMAGVNPWNFSAESLTVWVTARVYPIRVAGNSGQLLSETSWEELGLPQERTTVTQKVRRVGGPDWELVAQAVRANGPARVAVALTMADQYDNSVEGVTDFDSLSEKVVTLVHEVEDTVGAPVMMVGTGPKSIARNAAIDSLNSLPAGGQR